MKKIIINADDYGLTIGCSLGIIKAMKDGLVTGTTVMINMPHAQESIILAKENNIYSMGLHLNLTYGKPMSDTNKVLSLVDDKGNFKKFNDIISSGDIEEIKHELNMQVQAFMKTGMKLTHIDSHHHIHMTEKLQKLCVNIARVLDVPIRKINKPIEEYNVVTTDVFYSDFYKDSVSVDLIKNLITKAPDGVTEIMTHPGYVDDVLINTSTYNTHRKIELDVLTNDELIQWVKNSQIKLISFNELKTKN
jgi:predicted glycoside hydrolase/deacetylase ChbG (UPF0249 family)